MKIGTHMNKIMSTKQSASVHAHLLQQFDVKPVVCCCSVIAIDPELYFAPTGVLFCHCHRP